jgi:HSP20 family protein
MAETTQQQELQDTLKHETTREVASAERTRGAPTYTPRVDILETKEELLLLADVPGVEQNDLNVQFENGELIVEAHAAARHTDKRPVYAEYGIGDFYRVFSISETIDAQKISAELKNGVLTLHLPKADAVKPRQIEVRAG